MKVKSWVKAAQLAIWTLLPTFLAAPNAWAQLNENCTVSILNRTSQVRPDGTWAIPNIPANFGPVRARATCVQGGITKSGQSGLFVITANQTTGFDANIILGPVTPIPTQILIGANPTTLTQQNQTVQLTVTGVYPDSTQANLTNSSTGTQYLISNPNLASITANGLLTAKASGTVVVQAINEGTQGLIQFMIALSADSDGDGILDDVELANGLDPNNPADALDDPDHDGLTNRDELQRGTQIHNPDTDGDGLTDGQEVNTFGTNPLLADSDGDGVPDNIEIATGSNPNNPASVNLAQALKKITVTPSSFGINVNAVQGEGFQQLTVTGEFILGGTINLTSRARGTNYASSNLNICNFGAEDGRVFGAQNGPCTITVTNSGFTAIATGTVTNFSPVPLSFVSIPGFANNVDVNGDFAYVAAGSTGLQVVSISNRSFPQIVASRDTPGNANDVRVVGNRAYIADGPSGLQIMDITNPLAPVIIGSLDTPGDASDVVVTNNTAFIADGIGGLKIVDVTNPAAPQLVGSLVLPGTAKGVDVDLARQIAVVAAGTSGLYVVNIANRAAPLLVGALPGGDVRDVALSGQFAFLADFTRSFTSVDVTIPSNPQLRASTPSNLGGFLMDVAVAGQFAAGADVVFVNGVPLIDITNPSAPIPRSILDFRNFRDDNGTGIALDGSYVYLTAQRGLGTENGTSEDTRLYIGQYLAVQDLAGVPPTVSITSPAQGGTVLEGSTLPILVSAVDDVAVSVVELLVDGQVVSTDTSAPYEFSLLVPSGSSGITVSARARDMGGNVGNSQTIQLTIIPDPKTTVTGKVVLQGAPGTVITPASPNGWFQFQQNGGTALITGTNQRSGNGSLEFLSSVSGASSALILGSASLQGFGLVSSLSVLNFDWNIAADSTTKVSPEIALRVFPFGDPRSFFLHFTPCTAACPIGVWQSSSALANLTIQQAENNPVPASVPADAFIAEIHLRGASPLQGTPYHAFDDNLRIAFAGIATTSYNFEATSVADQPVSGATITILNQLTATSDANGNFSLAGVPTIKGPIFATVLATISGAAYRGFVPGVAPVPAGITNLGTIPIRRGGRLFGTSSIQGTNPGSIFIIDTDTGVANFVGKPQNTPNGLSDLSFDPLTGTLYVVHGASSRGAELLTVDPTSAQVLTRVFFSSPGKSIAGSDALAHDANGTLYAGVWSAGRLLRLNPATGVALSDIAVPGGDHLADLAVDFTTGELWAARGGNFDGHIEQLNPQTAQVIRGIQVPGNPSVTGIAFDFNGTMYVSIEGNRLATVDKNTGVATFIGPGFGGPKISGLGFEQ